MFCFFVNTTETHHGRTGVNHPWTCHLKFLVFIFGIKKPFFVFLKHSQLRFPKFNVCPARVHNHFEDKIETICSFLWFSTLEPSIVLRPCGTAPCIIPSCWTEWLLMGRRSSWPCLHIWRSVFAPPVYRIDLSACLLTFVPFLCSWTTASSLPSSLKTSVWCSTRETLRSPLLVLSGTCLGADTLKLLTGKALNGWSLAASSSQMVSRSDANNKQTLLLHYSNRVTGIYELSLCKISDTGSPGESEWLLTLLGERRGRRLHFCELFPFSSIQTLPPKFGWHFSLH